MFTDKTGSLPSGSPSLGLAFSVVVNAGSFMDNMISSAPIGVAVFSSPPWIGFAVLLHEGSTLVVVVNALRLLIYQNE